LIRHRGKVEAVVGNARLLSQWRAEEGEGVLDTLVWSCATPNHVPRSLTDVPAQTAESLRLTQLLRRRGWRFIGPTSAYAAMQAMGVVDDHLEGCHVRGSATRPSGESSDRR
jgi:DNA-3-methyladenine glycosylase I